MKNLTLAVAIISFAGFGTAVADTVNPANVTTFQSGTPALASEVNTTIQAVITAINDNATRLAAVEAAQASLVPGDINGNVYCFFTIGAGVGASDPNPATGLGTWAGASAGRSVGQVTFTSPTQATFTLTADDFQEALSPTYQMFDASEPLGSEQVTWTLVGNKLTVTFSDGFQDVLIMTPDANIFVSSTSELDRSSDNSGNWFLADMVIGVRAQSCN